MTWKRARHDTYRDAESLARSVWNAACDHACQKEGAEIDIVVVRQAVTDAIRGKHTPSSLIDSVLHAVSPFLASNLTPKLTEQQVMEIGRQAFLIDGPAAGSLDFALKSALRAAGVRFKDES